MKNTSPTRFFVYNKYNVPTAQQLPHFVAIVVVHNAALGRTDPSAQLAWIIDDITRRKPQADANPPEQLTRFERQSLDLIRRGPNSQEPYGD